MTFVIYFLIFYLITAIYKNPCDIALDYINECIGAKVPNLKQCDEGVAIEIVNTPCSELSKVIFDK